MGAISRWKAGPPCAAAQAAASSNIAKRPIFHRYHAACSTLKEVRLAAGILLGSLALYGQTCAPLRIAPAATVSSSLDGSSCLLPDGTAYQSYRLVLPARGQIQISLGDLTSNLALILRDRGGAQIASGLAIQQPIEAGTYTLLVNGQTPGQVGGYTVQTAFTAEPGMLCATFDSLGLNDAAAGTLGMSGCALPSGAAYEGYAITTLGSGSLTIAVSSPDFTPTIVVRQPDGTAVASGGALQVVPVYANTPYEILISTADAQGAYNITTSFQPADGETCIPQATFSATASDTATVGPSNCTAAAADGSLLYFTYYNLALTAAGLADLAATSSDFTPSLTLLDQSGNRIASNSALRAQLGAGNYVVEVVSVSGGAYTFSFGFSPGPPQPCSVSAAATGAPFTGALAPSACFSDLYSVSLSAAGALDVTLASTAFAGRLAIRDAKDNLILRAEDSAGLGSTELITALPAGSYIVAAASLAGAGAYQLTPDFTARVLTPCTYIQPIDNNGGYIANLGEGSCQGPNGQPLDTYQFTLPADGVVLAVMTSSQINGHLTLTDQSGNFLRSDENSYAPNDPLIIQYLPAGTYQLQATAASATAGGYYEVDVRTTAGPRPPFCLPQPGLTGAGSPINGTLNYTSCQSTDSTFADVYSVTLAAAATLNLELDSTAFDGYLVLLDAERRCSGHG